MSCKGLKFVALNIRSLYPSIDEVRCKFKSYDVIGVCETWLNNTYDDTLVNIENFTLYRADRELGNIITVNNKAKRGGGLALYVGSKFKGHAKQFVTGTRISENLEQLWLMLEKPNVRRIAVCMLYRPPSGNIQNALDELSDSIEQVQSIFEGEFVIMGDMNINYRDRHSKAFDNLKEFERAHNFEQLIKDPTRITMKSKSTIDLIWTNMEYISDSGVLTPSTR